MEQHGPPKLNILLCSATASHLGGPQLEYSP